MTRRAVGSLRTFTRRDPPPPPAGSSLPEDQYEYWMRVMSRAPMAGTPTKVGTLLSRMFVPLTDHRGDPATGNTHEALTSRSAFTGTGGYGTGVLRLYELKT